MTYYLLCSPAMYHVVVFDTLEEAVARREFLRRPDWRIFESKLMESTPMRKMYIAVLDDAPDYMVPTLVAHSAINAHRYFEGSPEYDDWLLNSFKKVVVRVGRKEFDKIASRYQCWKGHENTICDAQPSCLVVLPMTPHEVPPLLTFAKLWKPKDYPID